MAKGTLAKENLIKQIAAALPAGSFIGEFDKKYYFWSEENGEKVQIAMSLTCPKNPVGGGIVFSSPTTVAPTKRETVEISEEEQDNIRALMEKLGL